MALSDAEVQKTLVDARKLWLEHNQAVRASDFQLMCDRYDQVIELLLVLKRHGHIEEVARFIRDPILRIPIRAFMRRIKNGS